MVRSRSVIEHAATPTPSGLTPSDRALVDRAPVPSVLFSKPVLIVEDDRDVQDLFALCLSDTCDVKRAATGGEALAILRQESVGAMVLDYRLPDRTGLEVLNDIRSARHHVAVVMVTGYGSEWICTAAFRLGVVDYLAKPVDVLEFVRCVHRALSQSAGDGAAGGDENADRCPAAPAEPAVTRPDLPIQKVVQLIQHRYWDSLSLGQLAREIGMSKYRLSHRFSEVMGVPLREYLLGVRLERAKHLLSAGHLSITEVAQAVGFSDLPRFDKLFRRHNGVTPSTYRSQTLARGGG
jgi:two-component system response regulator YesN